MIKEHQAIISEKGVNRNSKMTNMPKRKTCSKGGGMGDFEQGGTDESESSDDNDRHYNPKASKTLNPRQRYE